MGAFLTRSTNPTSEIEGQNNTEQAHIKRLECASIRKTTRMARKGRSNMCPTTNETAMTQPKQCMRPGPVQRNPYLNFLREYRKKCLGLSAVETVRQGARAWKSLSQEDKQRFIIEAYHAPKRKHRRTRNVRGERLRKARKRKIPRSKRAV